MAWTSLHLISSPRAWLDRDSHHIKMVDIKLLLRLGGGGGGGGVMDSRHLQLLECVFGPACRRRSVLKVSSWSSSQLLTFSADRWDGSSSAFIMKQLTFEEHVGSSAAQITASNPHQHSAATFNSGPAYYGLAGL